MIAGMCKIWCRKARGFATDEWSRVWQEMPYAARSYSACDELIDIYIERFGNMYEYTILSEADNRLRTV